MKKLVIGMALFFACGFGGQAWATALLSFNPIVSSIGVGSSLDVDVMISGVDSSSDVGAFDFNIFFNDDVLAFDSYTLTDNLGDISLFEADDWSGGYLGGGIVNLSELSWLWDLSFQPDSFTLATLSFTGIGAGASLLGFELGLSPYYVSDAYGNEICALPGIGLVNVKPVPEPGTMLLLGVGLVGVFGIAIKRKKTA